MEIPLPLRVTNIHLSLSKIVLSAELVITLKGDFQALWEIIFGFGKESQYRFKSLQPFHSEMIKIFNSIYH